MSEHETIRDYLHALERRLTGVRWLGSGRRRRVIGEAEDHLRSRAEARVRDGANRADAERTAIREFGEPEELVATWSRFGRERVAAPLRLATAVLAALTMPAAAAVGLFALFDDAGGVAWTALRGAVAAGILASGGLTFVWLVLGRGSRLVLGASALGLFYLGGAVLAAGLQNAWFGADPEYWVAGIGALLTLQGAGSGAALWLERGPDSLQAVAASGSSAGDSTPPSSTDQPERPPSAPV